MTTQEAAAPRWDLTSIFPSLESLEFNSAFDSAIKGIEELASLFEHHQVRRREQPEISSDFISAFETVTSALNGLNDRLRTIQSYLGCFVTTDARNDLAKSRSSQLNTQTARLEQLTTRYVAWVGTADVEALLLQSETARNHEYVLRKAVDQARHQMPEGEEALAAELRASASTGWSRLHGEMSALLPVPVPLPEGEQILPMSSVRALATDPRREVRKAAYEAELKAWESVAVPFAAALNGIKGYQQTIRRRRGYSDDVEPTLQMNGINKATLEAMQQACWESFPDFRRYMAAKAKALGIERLAWYDLIAPVGSATRSYSWPEAETFLQENFRQYSSRLEEFAARSFRENWTDAEPRLGKQGGAYCTGIRPGESRIMMNYDGSFNSVSTLAHELGHAYHNLNLQARTPLQRGTPMTLAETASIFCETLAFEAALSHANQDEKFSLLNTVLERNLMVVVDIHSRFLFEQSVFEKRAVRDLTVSEFNALMLDAQKQTYGEDLEALHPYMWAVKGHYYGPLFYNYPYTFGLLFGLGLYARYLEEPDVFRLQYDSFLSSTGLGDAITLSRQFGADITGVEFWRSSLNVIRDQINEFERLVG